MKYLKILPSETDYQSYINGGDYVTPHVVLVRDSNAVKYQTYIAPPPPINVGDVAYWDGSSVKTVPLSNYNIGLGTPVGVVMIANNFLPDGKARIISLNDMRAPDGYYSMAWYLCDEVGDGWFIDSSTPNFEYVPTTDNIGSTTPGCNYDAYLPRDKNSWYGPYSYVDPLVKYYDDHEDYMPYIPSPYLSDGSFNPQYSAYIEGGNALSDFNGLSNTLLLVNESERYHAAHACWNYKDAANSNLQWYLPAIGELGFLMPRFELINQSIQSLIDMGVSSIEQVNDGFSDSYWSSSEEYYPSGEGYMSYSLHPYTGHLFGYDKGDENSFYVRAVASL